jgi:hypothetical protein
MTALKAGNERSRTMTKSGEVLEKFYKSDKQKDISEARRYLADDLLFT